MNNAPVHGGAASAADARSGHSQRMFTWRSGGWVIALAMAVTTGLGVWAIAPALMRSVYRPPGDGRNIDSYKFDLSNLAIPREDIYTNVMKHRDMVPVMFNPTSSGPTSPDVNNPDRWDVMQQRNDPKYGKYLVSNDRVIGVEINGQSRCYPISVMAVHEIINDTLGDPPVPIAVIYNWPCDAIMVFDRRVDESHTLTFSVSGLIYNSNTLIYDVRPTALQTPVQRDAVGGESLFCPIQGRAVSGEWSGATLTPISASLATWHDWSTAHPQTTVLDRDLSMDKRYKEASPTKYFQDPKPLRPVKPEPPPDGLPAKTPLIIVKFGDDSRAGTLVFPVASVVNLADDQGRWTAHTHSGDIRFTVNRDAHTVAVEANQGVTAMYSFWFAWHAMFPESQVMDPRKFALPPASN